WISSCPRVKHEVRSFGNPMVRRLPSPGLPRRPREKPKKLHVSPRNPSHWRGAVEVAENNLRTKLSARRVVTDQHQHRDPCRACRTLNEIFLSAWPLEGHSSNSQLARSRFSSTIYFSRRAKYKEPRNVKISAPTPMNSALWPKALDRQISCPERAAKIDPRCPGLNTSHRAAALIPQYAILRTR